jgi:hypothetical protein
MTIAKIVAVLGKMEAAGVPQWKLQLAYEAMRQKLETKHDEGNHDHQTTISTARQ